MLFDKFETPLRMKQLPDKKIKAVLFDLGETLLNFGKVNTSKLFRQGAKLSYKFLRSCSQPPESFKSYCRRNLTAIRLRYFLSNVTGKDFDALELLKKIGEKKGYKLDDEQWRHLAWLWYEPLSRVAQAEENINETLASLKKAGLKLGIVSNTFITRSALEKHLERLGILDFFAVKLYSYEFNFRKPNIRIFEAAAEKIGEARENILFVGDRIDKDIRPAAKIGMKAVLKTAYTNIDKKLPKGVWKINRLCELPGLIEKINENS